MKSVLVGYERSDEARDALTLARVLAVAEGAELHVAGSFVNGPVPWTDDAFDKLLEEHFESLFAEVTKELDGVEFVAQRMTLDPPAMGLQRLAEELEPEMIVLGSTRRGKVGRVLIGSVAERLLHGSPCPVVVAPRGYAGSAVEAFRTVGVGYDGGEEAKLAFATAQEWAERFGATLRLIAVAPRSETPYMRGSYDAPFEHAIEEDLTAALAEARNELGDIHSESVIAHGDPVETLMAQSAELDLLAIGSRGYGPVRRILLGGVSSGVMRSAACPVLVTPRSAAAFSERRAAKAAAAAG